MEKHITLFEKLKKSNPRLLIGGSEVLKKYGLLKRESGDLDIACGSRDYDFIKFCRILSKINPIIENTRYYYQEKDNHIRFMFDGIKVCLFVYPHLNSHIVISNLHPNEVSLKVIIDAKKEYIRSWEDKFKGDDWLQRTIPPYVKKHMDDLKNIYKFRDNLTQITPTLKKVLDEL